MLGVDAFRAVSGGETAVNHWHYTFTDQQQQTHTVAFAQQPDPLTVLDGSEVVYLAARNSAVSHSLVDFKAGMRLPAAFTATGKAFLSHMSDFEVKRLYVDGLPPPRTPHSVQSIEKLLEELQETRRRGYSIDDQQVAEGIICYGSSVLDSRNRPMAGIAVSLLAERPSEEETARIISNVQRIAKRLSVRMGADLRADQVK